VHRSTFIKKIKPFRSERMYIPETGERHKVIYVDGIHINKYCYLIARNEKYVIGFSLVVNEGYKTWKEFLSKFPNPEYVVCDGQKGLHRAIKECWEQTKVQTCIFHV
jgi:hypothetical protein